MAFRQVSPALDATGQLLPPAKLLTCGEYLGPKKVIGRSAENLQPVAQLRHRSHRRAITADRHRLCFDIIELSQSRAESFV